MYRETTKGVIVSVMPVYIDERSDPVKNQYFWAYRVLIKNTSSVAVQLISRYWHITDANGLVEEVEGAGVVGEQPEIHPDKTFEYTSGCPLTTPSGIMAGHYMMKQAGGDVIRVTIPAFSLDLPDVNPIFN